MTVTAKFQCNYVNRENEGQVSVHLTPVSHENDPDHPNYSFWQATPSGSLDMLITNTPAADYFEQGAVYTMTLDRDPEPVSDADPGEAAAAGDQA